MIGGRFLQNIVERRSLLLELVRRDFKQRYVGSAAGWLWGLVHPLVLMVSWTFVFQYCLRAPMPQKEVTDNYTLFLVCGYLPWMLFQETVVRSAPALVEQSNLITKTVFPSEIIPISIFLSSLLNHLLALVLASGAVVLVTGGLGINLWLLPVYTAMLGLFAIGVAWVVSGLHVYLRDTAQMVSVVLTFWFWMTPIFISEQQVPESFRWLVVSNPLSYMVRGYRERLLTDWWPSWGDLGVLAAYSAASFLVGGLFFRHVKRGFADVL
jgi:ABC-type polysaccharide/polyol phosphate export permease